MERADFWRESQRTGRLPLKTKIIYALGEMPGSHMNSAIGTLLALYYNQILGVSASIIAIAMGLALFLDAVSDPVVGTYSDNLKTNLGRRHPLMYAAALPLGIFMALLFSPPAGLGESSRRLAYNLSDFGATDFYAFQRPVERNDVRIDRQLL